MSDLGGIRLEWEINSVDHEGHYVYRSPSPMDTSDLPTPIAVLGPNQNYYNDNDIVSDVLYYYRVASYSGTETAVSDEFPIYSATKSPSFVEGTDFGSDSSFITSNSVVYTGSSWLLANDGGNLYRSGNGLEWTQISAPTGDARFLAIINSTVVLAANDHYGDKVSRSPNKGVSWEHTRDPFSGYIQTLGSFKHAEIFYLYSRDYNDLHISIDYGESWESVSLPTYSDSLKVAVEADLDGGPMCFLFGAEGLFYYSYDGEDWNLGEDMPISNQIVSATEVTVSGTNKLFVFDDVGHVATSTNGKYYEQTESLNGEPIIVATDGKYFIIAALSDGTLDYSTNYGTTWSNVPITNQWETLSNQGIFYHSDFGWLRLSYGNDGDSDMMRPAVSAS